MTDNDAQNAQQDPQRQQQEHDPAVRMPLERGSVSALISQLKHGDEESIRVLWDRYAAALIGTAQRNLRGHHPAKQDPEELAQSVFLAIYRGAINNRFEALNDRAGFWNLILTITQRKAIDRLRRETRQKRGGRKDESQTNAMRTAVDTDEVPSPQATPDIEVECGDLLEHLLRVLDSEDATGMLSQIAANRIAGWTVKDIASALDRTDRTIERKLERIRSIWAGELKIDEQAGQF